MSLILPSISRYEHLAVEAIPAGVHLLTEIGSGLVLAGALRSGVVDPAGKALVAPARGMNRIAAAPG